MRVLESIGRLADGVELVRGVAKQAWDFVQPAVNSQAGCAEGLCGPLGWGALLGLV